MLLVFIRNVNKPIRIKRTFISTRHPDMFGTVTLRRQSDLSTWLPSAEIYIYKKKILTVSPVRNRFRLIYQNATTARAQRD